MQPAHEQAEAEVLPKDLPASSRRTPGVQQPRQQHAGCVRWAASAISVVALACLATVMFVTSPDRAFDQVPHEDSLADLSPKDILRRQLQVYRPESQRYALHFSLARIFFGEGRLADAVAHYSEALPLARSRAEQAVVREALATALLRQGRLGAARELLKAAIDFADEEQEVEVLHTLADVRLEMGHSEAALKLYHRAFDIADRQQDSDRAALIAADIGEALSDMGKLEDSVEWLHTATEILDFGRASPAGADEVVAAKVHSRRGAARRRQGAVMPAMELYRKALRAQMRLLYPSHPDVVATRLGMVRARRDLGELDLALRDVEALEKTLRDGPQEGLDLSRVLIIKSDMLREGGDVEAAEQSIREAMQLQASLLKEEDHPEAAMALSSLGSILHDAGKAIEAHKQYSKALEISQRTLGEKHPGTAAAHNSLGTLYEDLGDDSTAREHFSKCLEIQLQTFGKASPDVANTYNNLATLLFRQGQPSEAAELLGHALQVLDQAGVPQDSPDRVVYRKNLEVVLSKSVVFR